MSANLNQQTQAQHHLDRALAALEADLPDQALTRLEACLKIDPGNLSARLAQARAALAVNRPRQALSALDCADLYHPDRHNAPEQALLRAQTLTRCHLDEMAGRQLHDLIGQFPDDVRPRRMLAQLDLRGGMLDEAIEQMRHVVRLEPGNAASRRTLAELLQDRDPQASIDLLQQLDPEGANPVTQLLTARLCHQADRLRDAQEIYHALLRARPEDATVWLEAGKLADALGDDAVAIARLERAAALSRGGRSAALTALALAHMHAGRTAVAGRCWWRLARSQGHQLQAWAGLMVCALACRRPALAEKASRILSRHWSAAERSAAVARLWPHGAGGTVIRRTIGADASSPAEADSPLDGLLAGAVDTFVRHLEQYPGRADANYHMARCRHALGEAPGARRAVLAALARNPRYDAARQLADELDAPSAQAA